MALYRHLDFLVRISASELRQCLIAIRVRVRPVPGVTSGFDVATELYNPHQDQNRECHGECVTEASGDVQRLIAVKGQNELV
jgi:hypothetical protein